MADALCGPANPIQQFQKHTQVDRTLQQDRLTSRYPLQNQGFRSAEAASVRLLDPEFEAFQTGQPPFAAPGSLAYNDHRSETLQPAPPANGGWAGDFARLQISPQPPTQFPQVYPQSNSKEQLNTSWHTEFAQSHAAPTSAQQPQQHQPQYGGMLGSSPFHNVQQPFGYIPSATQYQSPSSEERWKGKGPWHGEESQQDQAAWDAEFESLTREQLRQYERQSEQQVTRAPESHLQELNERDTELEQGAREALHRMTEERQTADETQRQEQAEDQLHDLENRLNANGLLPQTNHGMETMRPIPAGDSALAPEQSSEHLQADVDAELARTAGVLLDTVSDNQSEKFQQSSFLALMRQFRDHEVKVEGDKVVDARPDETAEPPNQTSRPEQAVASAFADPMAGHTTRREESRPTAHPNGSMGARPSDRSPLNFSYAAHVSNVADQMDSYMRPGGHPVDDF